MWTKITKQNDWGSVSYWDARGNKKVKFDDRQRVDIRLPTSGITTRGQVHVRTVTEVVNDHGHSTTVYSTEYEVIYATIDDSDNVSFEIVPLESVECNI